MARTEVSTRSGSGIWGLAIVVFIVFLILKLTGVVAWSWVIVLLPLIIAAGLSVLGLIVGLVVLAIIAAVAASRKR